MQITGNAAPSLASVGLARNGLITLNTGPVVYTMNLLELAREFGEKGGDVRELFKSIADHLPGGSNGQG